jgi:hypothetical protein
MQSSFHFPPSQPAKSATMKAVVAMVVWAVEMNFAGTEIKVAIADDRVTETKRVSDH